MRAVRAASRGPIDGAPQAAISMRTEAIFSEMKWSRSWISTRVNKLENDDASVLDPVALPDEQGFLAARLKLLHICP